MLTFNRYDLIDKFGVVQATSLMNLLRRNGEGKLVPILKNTKNKYNTSLAIAQVLKFDSKKCKITIQQVLTEMLNNPYNAPNKAHLNAYNEALRKIDVMLNGE